MRTLSTLLFEKKTDLLPYYQQKVVCGEWKDTDEGRREYSRERVVTLILALGVNERGKNVARIKCPVNPFPIRGEFEYISPTALTTFLKRNGWFPQDKVHPSSFRIAKEL